MYFFFYCILSLFFININIFSEFIEKSNVEIEKMEQFLLGGKNDVENINNDKKKTRKKILLDKNNFDNYNYLKKSILNQVELSIEDYRRIDELKEYIFNIEEQNKKLKKKDIINIDKEKAELKNLLKKQKVREIKEIILNEILENSDFIERLQESKCPFTINELSSLRIFDGKNNGESLLDIVFNIKTAVGKILNCFKVISPDSNIENNFEIIDVLSKTSVKYLDNLYNDLNKLENGFLSVFSNKKAYKRFKMGDDKFNAYIDFSNDYIKYTNHLNKKFLKLFLNPYLISIFVVWFLHIGYSPRTFAGVLLMPFGLSYSPELENIYSILKNSVGNPENLTNLFPLVLTVIYYFIVYKNVKNGYNYFNPGKFYSILAKRFYKIKGYITKMEEIFDVFQTNEELYLLFKDKLKNCRNLFVDRNGFNKEQNELLDLLKVIPQKWSYWKVWGKGRARKLCRFLYLFDKHKHILYDAILEIAEIESYLNVVKLLKDEKYKDKICIPTISNNNTPVVIADDAWNPFINVEKAITNNIRLGRDVNDDIIKYTDKDGNTITKTLKNGYSTGILYGMNAGGKTTTLETISLLYLMAKCYGICFAKNAEITNFKRLYTMIDITTDLSKGYSRYMSEVIAVDKLLDEIHNINSIDDSILLICDELFAGTNPEAAGKLSVNVLNNIVKNKYVVSIFSTHNKKPTELEKNNNLFRNLHMSVDTTGNDITYNYKIEQGFNEGNLAESLIKHMSKKGLINNSHQILSSYF